MSAHYRSQRGDTIIEVLIAITVAASVLGIVFATSARNIRSMRDVQERSEATRLIQGQIEALRYLYGTNPSLVPASGSFCMKGSAVVNTPAPAPTLAGETFTGYHADCVRDGLYHYAITANLGVYKFYARWNSLTVTGRDEVIMVYKVD